MRVDEDSVGDDRAVAVVGQAHCQRVAGDLHDAEDVPACAEGVEVSRRVLLIDAHGGDRRPAVEDRVRGISGAERAAGPRSGDAVTAWHKTIERPGGILGPGAGVALMDVV